MTIWQEIPPGPELRRAVAERLGWHMRKIWVGSADVEYDFIVYDHEDRYVYQREITSEEIQDEQMATDATWVEAMEDDATPRWGEDIHEARWLVRNTNFHVEPVNGRFHAWVDSPDNSSEATTEPLALVRAWLNWIENRD